MLHGQFTWKTLIVLTLIVTAPRTAVRAQLVISGNENKIGLTSGAPAALSDAEPDSISLIDFSQFPPKVTHTPGLTNTVIGPPSNLMIAFNGRRALLANSLTMDSSATPDPWVPNRDLHLLDLTAHPIKVVATVEVGPQPSGMSITPSGQLALVANRAGGTVSVVKVSEHKLEVLDEVVVATAEESVSDIAIHPQGHLALASVQLGGYLAVLSIDGETVTATEQKFSVCGQPYRVVITPDGQLGLTAGAGPAKNGVDVDALSIVDLTSSPPRTIDYVPIGSVPESIEVSPDGQWVAAVLMAGSNFPETDARHTKNGQLALLKRNGKTFELAQRIQIGRIPEGVAFTADGQYLLAQCHADRNIYVFKMTDRGAEDTNHRIDVPGFPSSLRGEY